MDSLKRPPEIYAMLRVEWETEQWIRDIFMYSYDIPESAISNQFHLTVYHARRLIPGIIEKSVPVQITADVAETRFMVFTPGGENPMPGLNPGQRSVGIRLTRRNKAISHIQDLRKSLYELETPDVIGRQRTPTSAWRNAFGARHYQPHIKLLDPGSGIDRDLTKLGAIFRSEIEVIKFDLFEVKIYPGQNTRRRARSSA